MKKLYILVVLGLLVAPLAKAQQVLFLNDGGYNTETNELVILCFNQTECYDVKTMQRIGDVATKVYQLSQKIDNLQNTITNLQQTAQQPVVSQPLVGAAPVITPAPITTSTPAFVPIIVDSIPVTFNSLSSDGKYLSFLASLPDNASASLSKATCSGDCAEVVSGFSTTAPTVSGKTELLFQFTAIDSKNNSLNFYAAKGSFGQSEWTFEFLNGGKRIYSSVSNH